MADEGPAPKLLTCDALGRLVERADEATVIDTFAASMGCEAAEEDVRVTKRAALSPRLTAHNSGKPRCKTRLTS